MSSNLSVQQTFSAATSSLKMNADRSCLSLCFLKNIIDSIFSFFNNALHIAANETVEILVILRIDAGILMADIRDRVIFLDAFVVIV